MRFYSATFRGTFALAVAVATLVVSVLVAVQLDASIITKALAILIISISGFHVAAWYAFERKGVWLVLDYALDAVTIVSLFAAVAGIQESAVSEILQTEFARRKVEQAQLVYVVKSTITNDCHPKESRRDMWTPSPEPYPGACDRMEHFLPQVEYIFSQETGIETMTADDSWARNFIIDDEAATGSWKGLYDEAKRFIEGSRRTKKVLDSQGQLASKTVEALAGSGKLQYWQFLLALVLGLRVARRSAGLLETRAKERKDLGATEQREIVVQRDTEPPNPAAPADQKAPLPSG
jgi:hypothetical protein